MMPESLPGQSNGRYKVEVVGSLLSPEEFDTFQAALGEAVYTLINHMHAPGTVVLVHRPLRQPGQRPVRVTLHRDRSHATVTF